MKQRDKRLRSSYENKQKRWNQKAERDEMLKSERASFANSVNRKIRVLFVNIGLGKQKTARNFWVTLTQELPLADISERLEKAFGDLK